MYIHIYVCLHAYTHTYPYTDKRLGGEGLDPDAESADRRPVKPLDLSGASSTTHQPDESRVRRSTKAGGWDIIAGDRNGPPRQDEPDSPADSGYTGLGGLDGQQQVGEGCAHARMRTSTLI